MQKYKVFLNAKSIIFIASSKITITKPSSDLPDFTDIAAILKWLDMFENSCENEIQIEVNNPEQTFHNFQDALLNVDAAGGVVRKNNKLLFIFRNDKWDLPKGKIDEGETTEEAALREVEEECGIQGHRILHALKPTYHIYRSPYKKSKGKWIFKKTHWFEMVYSGEEKGIPETDEGITEIRWFKPEGLDEVLKNTYANLEELITSYRG